MSSTNVAHLRRRAFISQSGLCFYCQLPMWERDPALFAGRFRVSVGAIGRFQCTAEHLKAKSCSGETSPENIVAACLFCNQTRHRAKSILSPSKYFEHVQRRLNKSCWHPAAIARKLLGSSAGA